MIQYKNINEVKMKSVLVCILMFIVALIAMFTGVFEVLASPYMMVFAVVCVVAAFVFALKVLGTPFAPTSADKDDKDDKDTD